MRGLINELTKLPSVGEKTAIRLAYHLLSRDLQEARQLAEGRTDACVVNGPAYGPGFGLVTPTGHAPWADAGALFVALEKFASEPPG